MKKIKYIFISLFAVAILASCSNPSNTSASTKSSGTPQTNDQPESKDTPRKDCSISLPNTASFSTNITLNIFQITMQNCFNTDTYKVEITSNPSNIQLSLAEFVYNEKTIKLFSATPGTIEVRLVNETAKVNSNICQVTFVGSTSTGGGDGNDSGSGGSGDDGNGAGGGSGAGGGNENGGGSGAGGGNENGGGSGAGGGSEITISNFVGTWYLTQRIIFDAIDFYANGTGKAYTHGHPEYGSNTFNWSIKNATTITLTNTTNGSSSSNTGDATFAFSNNFQTLTLVNFLGVGNYTITCNKQ